jgi:uncharacterized Ntn-hydrolase superfamily protein
MFSITIRSEKTKNQVLAAILNGNNPRTSLKTKNNPMKRIVLLTLFLTATITFGQHTFSIVAVDPVTGEIGSAGATCIDAEDGAQVISDIVLGVGAIHTQSFYIPANQNNARARMEAGDSPQEIIDWLIANDVQGNPSQRQYNIVDLNGGNPRSAAFTGANCFAEFIDVTGPNYAIAGNILISEDVVTDMETAFVNTQGTLADKLMAALQGAKRPGADSRCLNFGISSASAFIRVADPSDTNSSYGNLSLDLNVWLDGVVFEPIDALQDLYDATLSVAGTNEEISVQVFPNPASNQLSVFTQKGAVFNEYTLVDINGRVVQQNSIDRPQNRLLVDVSNFAEGVYFLSIGNSGKQLHTEKIVIQR